MDAAVGLGSLAHPTLTLGSAAAGGLLAVVAVVFVLIRLWLRVITFAILALVAGVIAWLASHDHLTHALGALHR